MRPLKWYGQGLARPGSFDDVSQFGKAWAVMYLRPAGVIEYGHQRFKSLECAFDGVNVFEAGLVKSFALVNTVPRPGQKKHASLLFDEGYTMSAWLTMMKGDGSNDPAQE